ncbi:MAG: TlyA family rRNA (cytidine-2'-O)-methyltransferase, partial [Gammaproteobacteria bacterium]|nr:TlyA family rRNA (cytidine-2'-O)-methyltransferase [Gammaproteobacteria bacterium]
MNKIRLDNLVLKLGFAETRSKAKGLIMAGHVKVDGAIVDKAGTGVAIDSNVEILNGV